LFWRHWSASRISNLTTQPCTNSTNKRVLEGGGGSNSNVWSYLTAGVVSLNVAANIVNNANENNNNNNNNNNQDNTNNNNQVGFVVTMCTAAEQKTKRYREKI